MAKRLNELLRLLRPQQWIKNVFVGAGVLFGAQLGQSGAIRAMLLAVVAFCMMSSSVYVLNDYVDRDSDRAHPIKRRRPIASGSVAPKAALAIGLICLSISLLAAWRADQRVFLLVLIYLAMNVAYTLRLKHAAVIDVFCIAAGFMLRILAGTWGIRIPPSGWLILTAMFLTLFLGFAKRRAEWSDSASGRNRRRVLNDYSQSLLDSFLSVAASGTALSYGLYTLDAQTIALHHTTRLIYTTPLVLFGLFRYLFLLHSKNRGENPSIDLFTDRQLQACAVVYAATVFWMLSR